MINNYNSFLLENVSMSLDMIINIIKSLNGDENKELVNKLVNYSDKNGKTVLMSIVQSNNQELIDYILTFDIDLQTTDNAGKNVLFYCKSMKTFKQFYNLNVGAMSYDKKQKKNLLVHLASRNLFNVEIYEKLILDGININDKDKYENNLIIYSILNKGIVKLLIKNNVDISDSDVQYKIMENLFTAFRYYKNKRTTIINIFKMLFDSGVKFNTHDLTKNIVDSDTFYGEKVDMINMFVKPLIKYIDEDVLISMASKMYQNKTSEMASDFANRLLNLGIFPKLYKYLKKFYGQNFNKFFKEYIDKHPYINDAEKFNI